MMAKRKGPASGGGAAAAPKKASKKGAQVPSVPPDALVMPHIRLYDAWAYLTSI